MKAGAELRARAQRAKRPAELLVTASLGSLFLALTLLQVGAEIEYLQLPKEVFIALAALGAISLGPALAYLAMHRSLTTAADLFDESEEALSWQISDENWRAAKTNAGKRVAVIISAVAGTLALVGIFALVLDASHPVSEEIEELSALVYLVACALLTARVAFGLSLLGISVPGAQTVVVSGHGLRIRDRAIIVSSQAHGWHLEHEPAAHKFKLVLLLQVVGEVCTFELEYPPTDNANIASWAADLDARAFSAR